MGATNLRKWNLVVAAALGRWARDMFSSTGGGGREGEQLGGGERFVMGRWGEGSGGGRGGGRA